VTTISPKHARDPYPPQDLTLLPIMAFAVTVILALLALVIIGAMIPAVSGPVQTAVSGTVGIGGGVVAYATLRRRPPGST
jgi:hypothetical protein